MKGLLGLEVFMGWTTREEARLVSKLRRGSAGWCSRVAEEKVLKRCGGGCCSMDKRPDWGIGGGEGAACHSRYLRMEDVGL